MLPAELSGGVMFYEDPAHRWTGQLGDASARPIPRARGALKGAPLAAWESFLHALPGSPPHEGYRCPVPGGWFVMLPMRPGGGVFFYRDPPHAWGVEAMRALSSSATMAGSGSFARASILLEWKPFRHALEGRAAQEGYRASVPGGWFVLFPIELGGGVFYYDDPTAAW